MINVFLERLGTCHWVVFDFVLLASMFDTDWKADGNVKKKS